MGRKFTAEHLANMKMAARKRERAKRGDAAIAHPVESPSPIRDGAVWSG